MLRSRSLSKNRLNFGFCQTNLLDTWLQNGQQVAKNLAFVLGKLGDEGSAKAAGFCAERFRAVNVHLGKWGDPLPASLREWNGDYIVSYLSRWVVPEWLLAKAKKAALNFHPASPEYPGIGCNNFALYENASTYGATCHRMKAKVDTGPIVAVRRFPVEPTDDVQTLLTRTYAQQLELFFDILGRLAGGEALPASSEQWSPRVRTRKELDALARITPEMSADEIARRIRATSFGDWQPTLEVAGFTFQWTGKRSTR